jgi:hypothetical protein
LHNASRSVLCSAQIRTDLPLIWRFARELFREARCQTGNQQAWFGGNGFRLRGSEFQLLTRSPLSSSQLALLLYRHGVRAKLLTQRNIGLSKSRINAPLSSVESTQSYGMHLYAATHTLGSSRCAFDMMQSHPSLLTGVGRTQLPLTFCIQHFKKHKL